MARNSNGVQEARKLDEDFTDVVFRFTGEEQPGVSWRSEGEGRDSRRCRQHLRSLEGKGAETPRRGAGFYRDLLHGETMDNVDADLLAAVYNPVPSSFMNAYIHGRKHKDLRFFMRTRVGALAAA